MDNNENKSSANEERVDIAGVPQVNRKFAIVAISVFISILVLPTLLWGVLKVANIFNPAIMEKIDFATDENRALAKFPEKFDTKTVTVEIENWYNDHLPFRSVIYTAQDKLDKAIEKPYEEKLLPALITLFHPSESGGEAPGGEVLEGIITEENTDFFEDTEEETLPIFETEESGDKDCTHVLNSGKIETEPTCTDYGIIRYSCTLCSYSYREYVKKSAHKYEFKSGTLQNCLAESEAEYECKNCGDTYVKSAKRGHYGAYIKTVEASYSDYGYDLHRCDTCGTEYRTKLTAKKVDNSYFPLRYQGEAIIGRDGWIFYSGNNSLDFYKGTNHLTPKELEYYTSILQKLQNLCDERGITLAFIILPNREQVYAEHMPSVAVENTYKRTEAFVDYVSENTDITILYPIEELRAAKPYYRVCYKYDTHWNTVGAFIGTQILYKAIGLESTDIAYCPIKENPKVTANGHAGGDLINIGGFNASKLEPDIEYEVTYKPEVNVTLLGGGEGNSDFYHTTSDANVGRNLVFIGDSFRVNMLSYLVRDFDNCFIGHRGYLGGVSEFRDALASADYIVIESVERIDTTICTAAITIYNILSSLPIE